MGGTPVNEYLDSERSQQQVGDLKSKSWLLVLYQVSVAVLAFKCTHIHRVTL